MSCIGYNENVVCAATLCQARVRQHIIEYRLFTTGRVVAAGVHVLTKRFDFANCCSRECQQVAGHSVQRTPESGQLIDDVTLRAC